MATSGTTPIVSFALFGAPMFKSKGYKFQPYEMRIAAEYVADVFEIGNAYKKAVTDEFTRTHGRTGRTVANVGVRWTPNIGTGATEGAPAVFSVNFPDTVSWVINPIPSHTIDVKAKEALSNQNSLQLAPGRQVNIYSDFGPAHAVMWYQGGPESGSPDRQWYQGRVQTQLDAAGIALLHRMAPFATNIWYEETGGQVLLAEG